LRGSWLSGECADGIGSVALMWLLTVAMMDLQLAELVRSAGPLIVILAAEILLTVWLARSVVFRLMGRDYEAATISAGMIGFALGAMSNAMASMRVMVQRFGPAPRAFLIVPIVGAFLVDFANALITTLALNLLR
ncbi:MAG TPA: sodium/glutamate symporter, partial [Opitutus sp.]|nr:sodium/glutamate symporter [Opitutus sp.]